VSRPGAVAAAGTVGLLLSGALLLAALRGLPDDDEPRALPPEHDTQATTPTSPPQARTATERVAVQTIYLIRAGSLAPVPRRTAEHSPGAALAALQAGPTPAESGAGMRSALVPGTSLRVVRRSGDLVVVDLSRELAEATRNEQLLALAQVVWTATGTRGVRRVSFTLEGRLIDAPGADGKLRTVPLRRQDFAQSSSASSRRRSSPSGSDGL